MASVQSAQPFPASRYIARAVGAEVARRRLAAGWTQNALAARADLAFNTIKGLERGEHDPGLVVLLKLVSAFDLCSIEELLGGGGLGTAQLLSHRNPRHSPYPPGA